MTHILSNCVKETQLSDLEVTLPTVPARSSLSQVGASFTCLDLKNVPEGHTPWRAVISVPPDYDPLSLLFFFPQNILPYEFHMTIWLPPQLTVPFIQCLEEI